MMRIGTFLSGLIMTLVLFSCNNEKHLINDPIERQQVETDFQLKMETLHKKSVIWKNQNLTEPEKEALKFLYAYMPIGDAMDYSSEYFIENIKSTYQAKEEMPWGEIIPNQIFRHFVLPIRINNENLDNSRMVIYEALKDRVKNLSLHDAILEVNHWCHEHVVYTPSDARTSSPLASIRTAYGRCGEESTLTVAALRAVGIPARQVYTPRWAHTDDNHAWVEAWVDGKWFFLGACEPEPVLNLAWFNAPAYRGMLMHTKVFGKYNGPEEIMRETACYTEINVIENYAPTAKAFVQVINKKGEPIEGATVEFKIYNYAEYYTVARKQTDKEGRCFLTAGKGDMLAWATYKGDFGCAKISFGKKETYKIEIDKKVGDNLSYIEDIVPPVEGSIKTEVTNEQKETNKVRLQQEDSIRNAYVATFITRAEACNFAKEMQLDTTLVANFLIASRGNYKEIMNFLKETPKSLKDVAVQLLGIISAKDLRDTPAQILLDCINSTSKIDNKLFVSYILNPRVSNELLTPYKSILKKELDPKFKEDPSKLVFWVKKNIKLNDTNNPQRIPISPASVFKYKLADKHSRDIFFVAAARSLGIPSRIEHTTNKIQYAINNEWYDVNFETQKEKQAPKGKVIASYSPIKAIDNPKYYSHFTIARILQDGTLQTLNFETEGNVDMGVGDTWRDMLKKPLTLDEGSYLLITGTRMASGTVLSTIKSFNIKENKTTYVKLVMRENKSDVQVIGSFNSESTYKNIDKKKNMSILQTTGRGYFIIGIVSGHDEPTNHAMRDIAREAKALEKSGIDIVLLFPSQDNYDQFDKKAFGILPKTITYGIDENQEIQKQIAQAMKLKSKTNLPIFIIADTFNRVVYISQGYTIGLGAQLLETTRKL